MKKWRVPVVWQMYGFYYIEAQTREDAIKEAYNELYDSETPLPIGEFLDDSLEVDEQGVDEVRGKQNGIRHILKTEARYE